MVPNNNNNKKKKNNALPLPDLSAAPQIKREWGEGLLPPFLIPPPPPCIALARPISGGAFLFFSGKSCFVRVRSRHIPQKKKKRQPGERKRETFFLPLPPVSSSVSRQFGPNSLNFFFPLPLSIPPIRPSKLEGRKECCWLPLFFSPCSFRSLLRVSQLFFLPRWRRIYQGGTFAEAKSLLSRISNEHGFKYVAEITLLVTIPRVCSA